MDEALEIVECSVVTSDELKALGMVDPPKREILSTELLFTVGEDATLYSLDDFVRGAEEGVCEIPDDVINKAFGPDAVASLHEEEPEFFGATDEEDLDHQPSRRAARFHLHYGAGRLGLGLVVPAIAASGIPFAVVQRPKPRWQEIFDSSDKMTVDVAVNDEIRVRGAAVITSTTFPENFPAQSLVFSTTGAAMTEVLLKATSFSCSLGAAMSKVMQSTLLALPEILTEEEVTRLITDAEVSARRARRRLRTSRGTAEDVHAAEFSGDLDPATDPRPVLFCTENDHAAVAKLKKALRTRVRVVDCMVDRVCTGRRILPEGVEITAEPWGGSIVVLEPGFEPRQVPFAPSICSLPSSMKESDYLSERKFSLVNGMHSVVAFMTLDATYSGSSGKEYVLLKYEDMGRAEQRTAEAWRSARVAQLLSDFGTEQLMGWSGGTCETREDVWTQLLDFADTVLEDRFSKIDDLVSRVLGGGVANRYQTRLIPTKVWMQKRANTRALPDHDQDDELSAFFHHAAQRDRSRAAARNERAHAGDAASQWDEVIPDELEPPFATAHDAEIFVLENCVQLVTNAKRFCSKEIEITHKALIKEQRKSGGMNTLKFSPLTRKATEAQQRKVATPESEHASAAAPTPPPPPQAQAAVSSAQI